MSNKVSVTVQTEQSKNFELDSRFKGQQNFDDGREQSFEACLLEKYIVFLKAETSPDFFFAPQVLSSALCKKEQWYLLSGSYQKDKESPLHLTFLAISAQKQRVESDDLWRMLLDPGFYIYNKKPDWMLI